jgi:hypothetical protein
MKVGQIIKLNKSGLASFSPGMRAKLEGQVGLVVQQKYDLAHKLDQSRLPERVKIYPCLVKFESLPDHQWPDIDSVMVFPDQAEILS